MADKFENKMEKRVRQASDRISQRLDRLIDSQQKIIDTAYPEYKAPGSGFFDVKYADPYDSFRKPKRNIIIITGDSDDKHAARLFRQVCPNAERVKSKYRRNFPLPLGI